VSAKLTLEQLIELARAADNDPVDFGMIEVDEDDIYKSLAIAVYKGFKKAAPETKDIVYLASTINLQVRNFVLAQEKVKLLDTISRLQRKIEQMQTKG
jgi:hypothetical protein